MKEKYLRTSTGRIRLGIAGMGYWGPNLLRNFQELPQCQIHTLCDLDITKLKPFAQRIPGVKVTDNFQSLLVDSEIDAVVIVTPVNTHFALASKALLAGKHVMIEKPLAGSSREGQKLIDLAHRKSLILMVGHTFEYHPAVLKIEELIKKRELGNLHYIDSVRVNLGRYQSDGRNVLWDLAPHDLSIILRWIGHMPVSVAAWGHAYIQKRVVDVAFVGLEFPEGTLAHIHVSWLSPAKIRRMTVVGSKKMIMYDDLDNLEKLKIADRSANLDPRSTEARIDYRMGDIVSPHLAYREPLAKECAHFVESIITGKKPMTDGQCGNRVVKILEAAERSLGFGGKKIIFKAAPR